MALETVTVRLSRSDRNTSWGFRLQGGKEYGQPLLIGKVNAGGLADRAGLHEGDRIYLCCGRNAESMNHSEAQNLIGGCGNNLDLVIHRKGSTIWSPTLPSVPGADISVPSIDTSSTALGQQRNYSSYARDYSSKDTSIYGGGAPVRVPSPQPRPYTSSSHTSSSKYSSSKTTEQQQNRNQYTSSPVPFKKTTPTLQPQHSPEAYLQQTGGLFGTDKSLTQPREEPSYMKSQTLKLIRESESRNESRGSDYPSPVAHADNVAPASGDVPVCENCGQKIIGVFCKAGGKTLHGECFKCSTCGTSLKNTGYFLVNEKLYCELHARQQKTNQFKATPPVDPNLFARSAPPPRSPVPEKAFYQPDILKPPGEIKRSFSPSSRQQQQSSSYNSSVTKTFGGIDYAPKSTGAPFQQSGLAAGDGIQMFGPKTPKRGRGILKQLQEGPRIPVCESCRHEIRGPFVLAMSKTWCPEHFTCATPSCGRQLIEVGFVEESGKICCEFCYEKFYAPTCSKCQRSITGDCLTALQRQWHPDCFTCVACHKPFGNASFFLENGQPYCENDWNSLFTTKCKACQFPIEAGDRWVEAMDSSYHSDCFCCTICQKTLEGQKFYAKGGRPYCKLHA